MYKKEIEYSSIKEFLPAETGISDVDLKIDSDEYQGNIINLSGYKYFEFIVKHVIVGTAPNAGKIDLYLYPYLDNGITPVDAGRLFYADQPVVAPAGDRYIVVALNTVAGLLSFSVEGLTGTLTTAFKGWQALGKCKFGIGPWEASNAGTSHVASLTVRASA